MSSGFSQGFAENQSPSSQVLRPPGGGSSDIFRADSATTPRTIRNHMASNIFGTTQEAPVKNNGDARRNGRDGDSYNRLFGGSERPYAPDQIETFKTNMKKVMKDVLGRFKDLKFFTGESMDCDGMCAIFEYREINGESVPVFMFCKHGLEEEKL